MRAGTARQGGTICLTSALRILPGSRGVVSPWLCACRCLHKVELSARDSGKSLDLPS